MKKLLLITAFCLFSVTLLMAQTMKYSIPFNNTGMRTNPLGKSVTEKDHFKHQTKPVLQNNKTAICNWDTIVTYTTTDSLAYLFSRTYNNAGNVLIEKKECKQNYKLFSEDEYTYTYDNNGNKILTIYKSWTNTFLIDSWMDSSTYNCFSPLNNRTRL